MKLGVFSVSMPEYNVPEAVALIKAMGYDAVEWRVDTLGVSEWFKGQEIPFELRYWGDNKATLDVNNIMESALEAKKLCDEAGIEIIGFSTTLTYNDVETLRKVLEAAKAIGCPQVRAGMYDCDFNVCDKTFPEMFDEIRAGNKALEPMLKEYGVKLLIETHHQTVNASPSSAYRMVEGLDPKYYGIIFDPGNMVFEGHEDYLKSFQMLGPYLAHVHVKNGVWEYAGEDEFGSAQWKQVMCPLNKGIADLKALIKALKRIGYEGALSVEDFSNEKPTREKLEFNIAYLRKLMAAE